MSKTVVGSIPEKICYVYSEEIEVPVGCAWDISWHIDDNKTIKEKVTPAFPVDNNNPKMLDRAKQWAEHDYYNKNKKAIFDVVENKPISNVRILSIEERGNGGRAYKLIIGKYYVDLREDVLMDALLQVGSNPKGILNGQFIWAQINNNMKLIRTGSELHRLVVEFESKKDIKPFNKNDLEIGGLYQDRKKNKAIFCGYVNTTQFKPKDNNVLKLTTDFVFKKVSMKKAMLFFPISNYEKLDVQLKKINSEANYYFKIKKIHPYIEKLDQIDLPLNIISSLRERNIKYIKECILEYTGFKPPKGGRMKLDAQSLSAHIVYNSEYLNLYSSDDTPVELFDVKKYLLFS